MRAVDTRHDAREPAHGAWIGLAILLFAVTGFPGCAAAPPQTPQLLGGYPHSAALDVIAQTHRQGADEDLVLLTTWFQGGDPRNSMMSRVRPDGRVSTFRYLFDYSEGTGAIQNSRSATLVPDQLADLRHALDQLPASQSPTLEHVLIVSFRDNGKWTTRTYDLTHLPSSAAELFTLTGAPLPEMRPQ